MRRQTLAVLDGHAPKVARAIRRQATKAGLSLTQRKGADEAADYLTSKAPYLDYPTALTSGRPIATGVIEGACRHLVADSTSPEFAGDWPSPGAGPLAAGVPDDARHNPRPFIWTKGAEEILASLGRLLKRTNGATISGVATR